MGQTLEQKKPCGKKPCGKKRNVVESNRLKTITKAGDASAKKPCGKKRIVVESNSAAPKRAKKQTAGGSTQADSSTLVARGKPKQQSDATGNELSQNSYARALVFSSVVSALSLFALSSLNVS